MRRSGTLLQSPEETKYRYGASGNLRQTEYQNGVFHDFVYDSLGRLDLLEHWHDANDNGRRDSGELRAQFDYTVRSDGKRTGSTEKMWSESGSLVSDQTFSWDYDNVDRLIKEEATGVAGGDYELDWVYDLVGNRLSQSKALKDASGAVIATESTTYTYDANDRLEAETFARTGTTPSSSNTLYTYNKTQQTSKATTAGSVTTTQTFSYNRQGLMASVITETSNEATLKRVDYSYDTGGHRVGTKEYEAPSSSPQAWTLLATTRYLTDDQNPTGYSQVLQETKFGSGGTPSKKIIYTIGHDQINQTVYENWNPANSNFELQTSHFFGSDGHGSVRVLYDAAAAIARDTQNLAQYYSYDAYGHLLSIGSQALPTSNFPLPTSPTPLTTYLYSGESFDFRIGQQYLRARWYDPANGRFTGLDPFAGNSSDPQSFHKYAYVHGDPVNGVDPSGQFLALAFGVGGRLQGHSSLAGGFTKLRIISDFSTPRRNALFLHCHGPFAQFTSSDLVGIRNIGKIRELPRNLAVSPESLSRIGEEAEQRHSLKYFGAPTLVAQCTRLQCITTRISRSTKFCISHKAIQPLRKLQILRQLEIHSMTFMLQTHGMER